MRNTKSYDATVEKYIELGNPLHEQKRSVEAVTCYRQALGLNPNHATAWNNLGAALYTLGRQAEAQVAYQEAVKLKPGYSEALFNLGVLLKVQGKYSEAMP